MDRVKNESVMKLHDPREVAACAVIEHAAAKTQDSLAVARSIGKRGTRSEVIVIAFECRS